jgi:hypothetical protein
MKHCEIIADTLSKAGWNWGCVSGLGREQMNNLGYRRAPGRRKRFIVRVDEKLTAFLELESAIRTEQ